MDGEGMLDSLIPLFLDKPLAQGVGIAALLVGSSAFTQRNDQRLRYRLTLFCTVMGVHFLLMGTVAAAVSAWFSGGRTLISSRTRSPWIMTAFLLLVWGIGLANVEAPVDWLPMIGTSVGTWALFREQGIRLRLLLFSGTLCWLTHNLLIGSIGGSLIEASFLCINSHTIYCLWRYGHSHPANAHV